MNKQEIFDTVVAHARQQNRKCADEFGKCRYRHNGDKCFAGALIPDNVYDPRMEDVSIKDIVRNELYGKPVKPMVSDETLEALDRLGLKENLDLVQSLQGVHDASIPNEWEEQLQTLAASHKLTYTPKE